MAYALYLARCDRHEALQGRYISQGVLFLKPAVFFTLKKAPQSPEEMKIFQGEPKNSILAEQIS